MGHHHDKLIAAATPEPRPEPRPARMTRAAIENLIRSTILPGGQRISHAAVARIADAWTADADTAHALAVEEMHDAYAPAAEGCTYTGGAGCYYG